MGGAAILVLLAAHGSVALLVVLYSINVFITFTLSQLGMARHWWKERAVTPAWKRKFVINGIGVCLCGFILVSLSAVKFWEGGWVTLVVTGAVIAAALLTRRHYEQTRRELARLDELVSTVSQETVGATQQQAASVAADPAERTAVVLVNGFNGLGLHTLLNITRLFPGMFRNFIFLHVGVVDAGNFKGAGEIENLRGHIASEAGRYADYMRRQGFHAEAVTDVGIDVVQTASVLAAETVRRYPNAVFFGGQLVFENESRATRLLHNFAVFALQREFFRRSLPFLIVPVRV
jgi:hypothetical protein